MWYVIDWTNTAIDENDSEGSRILVLSSVFTNMLYLVGRAIAFSMTEFGLITSGLSRHDVQDLMRGCVPLRSRPIP